MNGNENVNPAPMPDNRTSGVPTPPSNVGGISPTPNTPMPTPPSASPPPPPPPPPPAPTSGPTIPPPPTENIDIRTMASDGKSLKASGGIGAEPKTFNPNDLAGNQATLQQKPQQVAPKQANKSSKKIIIISTGIVVVLAAAGAVAYFFVIPMLQENKVTSPIEEPVVEEVNEEPVIAPFTHTSAFSGPIDGVFSANLTILDLSQISAAMQTGASEVLQPDSLQEIIFQIGNVPVSAKEFTAVILPSSSLASMVSQDFTAFMYHDENGSWPGYVFHIESELDKAEIESNIQTDIEAQVDLSSLYLTAPGTQNAAGFKSGSISTKKGTDIKTRYTGYSTEGASFNYGWIGDYLIMSTSFSGMQRAVDSLSSEIDL